VNWVGSPQSAFTTTLFNILQIKRCKEKVQTGRLRQETTDAYFVLSCMNQYSFPRYQTIRKSLGISKEKADKLELRRTEALFYGLFRPLSLDGRGNRVQQGNVKETAVLLANLANQLRMLRSRGVYPMILSVLWFLLSYGVSLGLAFGDLGDNTTAHSLALGLLLSWLPALVCATMIDRNPVAPVRCRVSSIFAFQWSKLYVLVTDHHSTPGPLGTLALQC
jgi:hypothetical protein